MELSALHRRLNRAEQDPLRDWVVFCESVPKWPKGFPDVGVLEEGDAYGPSVGESILRRTLSARDASVYGGTVSEGEVAITNGALHGISLLLRDCAAPGSSVLVQSPCLRLITEHMRDQHLNPVLFDPSDIRERQLVQLAQEEFSAVYLTSPSAPFGRLLDMDIFVAISEAARAGGALVILDAVFDAFVFEAPPGYWDDWGKVLRSHPEAIARVNSFSKTFAAPGLRVGWINSDNDRTHRVAVRLEREQICPSPLTQAIARRLLERGAPELKEAVADGRRFLAERLPAVIPGFSGVPIAGTQLMLALPVDDIEAFADAVLEERGLILASGSNFEGLRGPWVRVPMGLPRQELEEGIERLRLAIPGNHPAVKIPRSVVARESVI